MSIASINPASRELLRKFQPLSQAEAGWKIEIAEEAYARRRALPAWQRREADLRWRYFAEG